MLAGYVSLYKASRPTSRPMLLVIILGLYYLRATKHYLLYVEPI